jgi:hypothetical protein
VFSLWLAAALAAHDPPMTMVLDDLNLLAVDRYGLGWLKRTGELNEESWLGGVTIR